MRGQYSEMAEYGFPKLQTAAINNQIRVLSVICGGLATHSSSFTGLGKAPMSCETVHGD
jgi:hypothetical protein